jgi:hypothetical protein
MTGAFPEAMVSGYEALIPGMKNDPEDRHVAAAAVTAGAGVIVTSNLRHFHGLPDGLQAQPPNAFLMSLFDADPNVALAVVQQQAAALKKPPRSFDDVLDALAKSVPRFTEADQRGNAPRLVEARNHHSQVVDDLPADRERRQNNAPVVLRLQLRPEGDCFVGRRDEARMDQDFVAELSPRRAKLRSAQLVQIEIGGLGHLAPRYEHRARGVLPLATRSGSR